MLMKINDENILKILKEEKLDTDLISVTHNARSVFTTSYAYPKEELLSTIQKRLGKNVKYSFYDNQTLSILKK